MNNDLSNIGINVKAPQNKCEDKICPFHGGLKVRGNILVGIVIGTKAHKTAKIEWTEGQYIPKFERYEKKRTKLNVHNPPCINAKEGDQVKVIGCRPISKTKNLVIIENLGQVKGFKEIMAARQESKVKEKVELNIGEKNEEPENKNASS